MTTLKITKDGIIDIDSDYGVMATIHKEHNKYCLRRLPPYRELTREEEQQLYCILDELNNEEVD